MYLLRNPHWDSGEGDCCGADASALCIEPSHMIRVRLDDFVQDWPWEFVRLCRNGICLGDPSRTTMPLVYYKLDRAKQYDKGIWVMDGSGTLLITPGPKR
jgi:hypothetical protein